MKSPFALLESLLTDVRRLDRGVKGLERDLVSLKHRFEKEGTGFLTVALPSLGKAFDKGLRDGKLAVPLGFKKSPRGALPRIFSGLLCKVFDAKTGILLEAPDVGVIVSIRQLLYFWKKATLSQDRVDELDRVAKVTFWKCDDEVLTSHSEYEVDRITSVSRLMLANLSDEVSSYLPKHGPGSVFEGCTSNQKWLEVTSAIFRDDWRVRRLGFDFLFASTFTSTGFNTGQETIQWSESSDPEPLSEQPHRGVARLVSVPKSSTSRRTITVEPVLNQFLQQQLNSALRDSITKCKILSNCLALTDQCENQKLAVIGSLTGEWATIDLSSASDLLGCELVKVVFRNRPEFLQLMLDCRSPEVIDGSTRRTLRKFAGMGNALTFPVQSVVFATLAITAILSASGLRPTFGNVRRASMNVRVYGDDIIVRTEHFHHVADWLTRCGLRLNESKTYATGNFRESCGVDAYIGVNVTPLYAKTFPVIASKDPDHLADMVTLANSLWERCMYHTSDRIRSYVEERFFPLPDVKADSSGLGWTGRLVKPSHQRVNISLQRLEVRVPVIVSEVRKDPLDGYPALLKFFLATRLERMLGLDFSRSSKRFKSKIRWKWVPAY